MLTKFSIAFSPPLFNIFLERIMTDALEEIDGKVSIGRRNITNLWFADDIDAPAEDLLLLHCCFTSTVNI